MTYTHSKRVEELRKTLAKTPYVRAKAKRDEERTAEEESTSTKPGSE